MAQYLILIYENEGDWESAGPETFEDTLKGHQAFGEANGSVIRPQSGQLMFFDGKTYPHYARTLRSADAPGR